MLLQLMLHQGAGAVLQQAVRQLLGIMHTVHGCAMQQLSCCCTDVLAVGAQTAICTGAPVLHGYCAVSTSR
jgi:hypothetical protein